MTWKNSAKKLSWNENAIAAVAEMDLVVGEKDTNRRKIRINGRKQPYDSIRFSQTYPTLLVLDEMLGDEKIHDGD